MSVEDHRHARPATHVENLRRAVNVFVVLEREACANPVGQRADDSIIRSLFRLCRREFHHRPRRARLFEHVENAGVRLKNLMLLGEHLLRIRTEDDELIGAGRRGCRGWSRGVPRDRLLRQAIGARLRPPVVGNERAPRSDDKDEYPARHSNRVPYQTGEVVCVKLPKPTLLLDSRQIGTAACASAHGSVRVRRGNAH